MPFHSAVNKNNTPLVIQPRSGIGDMIWHLRPIHAIAANSPTGKVFIATKASSLAKDLLRADPAIDRVDYIDHRDFWRSVGILRSFNTSQAWILHNSVKYAVMAALSQIPHRIGYGYKHQKLFLTDKKITPQFSTEYDAIEKSMDFLATQRLSLPSDAEKLVCDPYHIASLRKQFHASPRPWASFGIGAGVALRHYPAFLFAQVATKWLGLNKGTLFIAGGDRDRGMAEAIVTHIPIEFLPHIKLMLNLPIDKQSALLSLCNIFVGNDSGLLNLAASVGTPAIGLFGASPALRYPENLCPIIPSKPGMAYISPDVITEHMQKELLPKNNEHFI